MSIERSSASDHETERIVRSWLSEGTTRLPDRVLDAVLDEVPSTPQRRAWWPAWRFDTMSNTMRIAIAAAAVLVVAILAINLLPGSESGVGGPGASTPTASNIPSASPGPTPTPTTVPGQIPAGPFAVRILEPTHAIQVDMPPGWTIFGNEPGFTGLPRNDQQSFLSFWIPDKVPGADACDPTVSKHFLGPSVEALADHIVSLRPELDVVAPVPATLGGYEGLYLEFTVTPDIPCAPGEFYPWMGRYLQGIDELDRIWILDVDGTRLIVDAQAQAGRTPADLAELQSMVDSIRITPALPSPTP